MRAELIDCMGDDLRVVNAARVSFDKESTWENEEWGHPRFEEPNYLGDKDERLIRYLSTHNHFTPFTHCMVTLRETVPIFVARQRFKHTVGFSYNEVSRRYVDTPPEFFVPDQWRSRPEGSRKQGSGDEVITFIKFYDGGMSPAKKGDSVRRLYNEYIENAKWFYEKLIANGVAPEQARMVLPQSMYTSYYVTGSLAAWARAYNLRTDDHAQKEIRDLAEQWDKIINPLFPISWKYLTRHALDIATLTQSTVTVSDVVEPFRRS